MSGNEKQVGNELAGWLNGLGRACLGFLASGKCSGVAGGSVGPCQRPGTEAICTSRTDIVIGLRDAPRVFR